MENISQANTQSFESIYYEQYKSVYMFFIKRLRAKEVCEDLTSDVFYSCFKNYSRYDPSKASIKTWIFAIANNRLKNYYRDRKNFICIDDENNFIDLPDDLDMDGAVFLSQMKECLMQALNILSNREKTIVEFKYFSYKTSDEIALEIGITAGNVRVILTRALKKLADYFEKCEIRWD